MASDAFIYIYVNTVVMPTVVIYIYIYSHTVVMPLKMLKLKIYNANQSTPD